LMHGSRVCAPLAFRFERVLDGDRLLKISEYFVY